MITITYNSRNDDHGGNLIPRIQTSIYNLCEQIERYGLDLDLVFVEWNPVEGVPRIWELIECPEWFPVRFIEVPAKIHNMYKNHEKLPVFSAIAMNVGMRRARGDWVLSTTHDILFSEEMAQFLAREEFDEGKFYRAPRMDVNLSGELDKPIYEILELCKKKIVRSNEYSGQGGLFTRACGDFILMTRDAWHKLEGFPEWPMLGMYYDGILLVRAYAMRLEQEILPHHIYHIEHGNRGQEVMRRVQHLSGSYWKNMKRRMETSRRLEPMNNPGWGLGYAEEVEISENVVQLRTDRKPNNSTP